MLLHHLTQVVRDILRVFTAGAVVEPRNPAQ
jgi:hypothetical protein